MTVSNHSNFGPYVPESRRIAHIRRLLAEVNLDDILPPNPTDEDLKVMGETLIKVANSMGISDEELGIARTRSMILTSGPNGRDVSAKAMAMYEALHKEDKSRHFIVLDSIPADTAKKEKLPFSQQVKVGTDIYPFPNLLSVWSAIASKNYPAVVNVQMPGKEEEAAIALKGEKAKLEDVGKQTSSLRSILKQSLHVKKAQTRYDNIKKQKRKTR